MPFLTRFVTVPHASALLMAIVSAVTLGPAGLPANTSVGNEHCEGVVYETEGGIWTMYYLNDGCTGPC